MKGIVTLQTQLKQAVHWGWNILAYGLWIVGAFLVWLVTFWSSFYLDLYLKTQVGSLIPFLLATLIQAVLAWLVVQIVLSDKRLPWIIVATLLGYIAGVFIERYLYLAAFLFFHLLPGNTVRAMFVTAIASTLAVTLMTAICQVLFLGAILKRVGRLFVVSWLAAATLAGIGAPLLSVAFEIRYYSASDMYPSLISSMLIGVITGMPLLWLRGQ